MELARTFLLLGDSTSALDAVHAFTAVNRRMLDACAAAIAPVAGTATGLPARGASGGAVATAVARLRVARLARAARRAEAGAVFVAALALEQQGRFRMALQAMAECVGAQPRNQAYSRGMARLRQHDIDS